MTPALCLVCRRDVWSASRKLCPVCRLEMTKLSRKRHAALRRARKKAAKAKR